VEDDEAVGFHTHVHPHDTDTGMCISIYMLSAVHRFIQCDMAQLFVADTGPLVYMQI
jgi:hypothetical protein